MPSNTQAVVRLVIQNWRVVARNWPQIVRAAAQVSTFLKAHPGLPSWTRERFADIMRRVDVAQQRRDGAERIRGMLAVVRDEAPALDDEQGGPPRSSAWLRRSDDIERGVRLAEAQDQPARRQALARLATRTDALVADLIEELTRVQSTGG